jgi:hypothetical protein
MNMARIEGEGNNVDMSKTTDDKVEIPANRYDLLCLEGTAVALKCYLSKEALVIDQLEPELRKEETKLQETILQLTKLKITKCLEN